MDYNIRYTYYNDYIHAVIEGKDSLETSLAYWIDLIEECRFRKVSYILIEEKLEGELNKSTLFRLNQELKKIGFGKIKRIAFIDQFQQHNDLNSFGVTEMLKLGLNIMIFDDQKTALKWLLPK